MDIREYTVSVGFEGSETGSSREIASFHDTTRDEHPVCQRYQGVAKSHSLRVAFMDTRQSGGSFQIRVDNHDLALVLLLASLVQYC